MLQKTNILKDKTPWRAAALTIEYTKTLVFSFASAPDSRPNLSLQISLHSNTQSIFLNYHSIPEVFYATQYSVLPRQKSHSLHIPHPEHW